MSEAKLSRREDEGSKETDDSNQAPFLQKRASSQTAQNQQDATSRYGLGSRLGLRSGLATTDSRSGQNPSSDWDSKSSSKKRKEPEEDPVAAADLDVSLEELESIMSEDMDEPLQPTVNKKQCFDQGGRSTAAPVEDCSTAFSAQHRAEKPQSIVRPGRNSDRQSSANRDPERKSRLTSNKTVDLKGEQHSSRHGNDKCPTSDVKEEDISFLVVRGALHFYSF